MYKNLNILTYMTHFFKHGKYWFYSLLLNHKYLYFFFPQFQTTLKRITKPTSSTMPSLTDVTMDTTRPKVTTALAESVITTGDGSEITTLLGDTEEPGFSTTFYTERTTRFEKEGSITTMQPKVEENEIPGEDITTENAVTITSTAIQTDTTHDTTEAPTVTPIFKGKTQKPDKPFTPFDTTRKPVTLQPGNQHKNFTFNEDVSRVTTTITPKGRTSTKRTGMMKPTSFPGTMKSFTPRVSRPSTVIATDDISTFTTDSETDFSRTTAPTTDIDISTIKTPTGVTRKLETTFMTESLPSTTETPDCTKMPCLNEGTCFFSKQGPKVSTRKSALTCD